MRCVPPAAAGMRSLVALALLAAAPLVTAAGMPAPAVDKPSFQADRILIEKGKRLLTLYTEGRPFAKFQVALGRSPVGRKQCQGDHRTPEGLYYVSGRKQNSDFHRALRISYPSEGDIERARQQGCDPGGDIMIHGLKPERAWQGTGHRRQDWTFGCVAVTNEEIERLWELVPDGAWVEIRP